jgi:GNAT superfamily N-acetyltransferase
MVMEIRPYQDSDLPYLYQICLKTGAVGEDATGMIEERLLGEIYAAPYVEHEPEMCLVLVQDDTPCGYILGTKNSEVYADWYNAQWLPELLNRYPIPQASNESLEASMIRSLHSRYKPPEEISSYPAPLHIDILPEGQGLGMGRRLMAKFLQQLHDFDVPGVHFGVSKMNGRAMAFYTHLGFHPVSETEFAVLFGMKSDHFLRLR